MTPNNRLTLAVAGSRKTQGIVEACAGAPKTERILVLTYTTANQSELESRLRQHVGSRTNIVVMGWFTFLIRQFVKPYVPFKFPGRQVRGFDFDTPPRRGILVEDDKRYFDSQGRVLKVHLPHLAVLIEQASNGAAIKRLCRQYDHIYIDECQDLCGYDLEVLKLLMTAPIPLELVGDVRQAVLATNPQEARNSQFRFTGIWKWFRAEESAGRLEIVHRNQTWRCRQEIASFADSLFAPSWGFPPTDSLNQTSTCHDGLFIVKECDVPAYLDRFDPLFLRYSKASGKDLPYKFMNFKISKGLTRERVLILPTVKIKELLMKGTPLDVQAAAELYVAATRAEQSVAFVLNDPGRCQFARWESNLED